MSQGCSSLYCRFTRIELVFNDVCFAFLGLREHRWLSNVISFSIFVFMMEKNRTYRQNNDTAFGSQKRFFRTIHQREDTCAKTKTKIE